MTTLLMTQAPAEIPEENPSSSPSTRHSHPVATQRPALDRLPGGAVKDSSFTRIGYTKVWPVFRRRHGFEPTGEANGAPVEANEMWWRLFDKSRDDSSRGMVGGDRPAASA